MSYYTNFHLLNNHESAKKGIRRQIYVCEIKRKVSSKLYHFESAETLEETLATQVRRILCESPVFSFLPCKELFSISTFFCRYGYQVTTLVMNQGKYLPWLTKRFRGRGGNIVKRKIQNLSEVNTRM